MSDTYRPDLDAYFARIRYHGSREISVEMLHAITACHAQSIPFENIDVQLGRPIDLAPEAIERKLVRECRGGYCFEQNQLLLLVLRALGFHVSVLSARVRWLLSRDVIPPRTHMFLKVELTDGIWITDVGVGGCSLTAALRFEEGIVQQTPHDQRRLIREAGVWIHQIRFDTEWLDVCEFTSEEMPLIDREIANWWTSTHPESKFIKSLIVALANADGSRASLLNRELTLRRPGQPAEKHELQSQQEVITALGTHFRLKLPSDTAFRSLDFEKLPVTSPSITQQIPA